MRALCLRELTAPGRGAVSVLELSGRGALERVRALCPAAALGPGRLTLARLGAGGEALDEALVAVFAEDLVELHLHGSPAVVGALRRQMGVVSDGAGATSLEERAAWLCAQAPSEAGARALLDQAEGALRRELERVLQACPAEQDARLAALLERGRVASRLLRPALVVLLGPPNAGKSTLFNALVGTERVLVSAEAGTTRDVICERAHLGPYPVDLVDGPGERGDGQPSARPGELLEREGGRLARELARRADLVLWLSPAPGPQLPPSLQGLGQVAAILSCADLAPAEHPAGPGLALSALTDPGGAARGVARLFRARLDLPEEPWIPGAGLPFEPWQIELLERARAGGSEHRREEVAALLCGSTAALGIGG